MEGNFELFEDGESRRSRDVVHVTLNKECRMFFNRRASHHLVRETRPLLLWQEES